MFFMQSQETTKDLFDFVQHMVRELILFECPEHRNHHHLLFTLNVKKHRFTEQLEQLQTMHDALPHIQQLALETRQQVQSQTNQFEQLEKAYLLTVDSTQRQQLVHALRFDKEKIEQLYTFYTTQKEVYATLERLPAFYKVVKEELLTVLVKLHY